MSTSDIHVACSVPGLAQNGLGSEQKECSPHLHCPDSWSHRSDPLVSHFLVEQGSV